MKKTELKLRPIGYVSSKFQNPKNLEFACEKGLSAKTTSKLIIRDEFLTGLDGLKKFSHLWIIYYLHKANRIESKTYPGPSSVKNLPKTGIFATRSQYRPNHIALRLTKIKKIGENTIEVIGLDAVDGSPILDIKPYVSYFDRPKNFKTASWYRGWNI